jgi:hypothetical protein
LQGIAEAQHPAPLDVKERRDKARDHRLHNEPLDALRAGTKTHATTTCAKPLVTLPEHHGKAGEPQPCARRPHRLARRTTRAMPKRVAAPRTAPAFTRECEPNV